MINIYKLLKHSKARGKNNEELCSEEDMRKYVKISNEYMFTNSDLEKQKEYLAVISEWKNRVEMLFEDTKTEKTYELIGFLLKQSLSFKFVVTEVEELKKIENEYKWNKNVDTLLNSSQKMNIEEVKNLISEGQKQKYDQEKILKIKKLLNTALAINEDVKKILLRTVEADADEVNNLYSIIESATIIIKSKVALSNFLINIKAWQKKCIELLSGEFTFEFFENIKEEAKVLNATCKEYRQLCGNMQSVTEWFTKARKLIEKFSSKNIHGLEQAINEIKKKSNHTKRLRELLQSANSTYKTSIEFTKILIMSKELEQWETTTDETINKYIKEKVLSREMVNNLLLKALEFPINKAKGLEL